MRSVVSLLVTLAVLSPGNVSAHRPSGPFGRPAYVFGDSLSDNGNLQAIQGPNAPPYDPYRASNGPIWVDDLALHLRTEIGPSALGGTNLSFAGATLATANKWDWTRSGEEMVREAIGEDGVVDPRASFVIILGVNDLDRPFYEGVDAETAARAAFDGAVRMVEDLDAAGARRVLIVNVWDFADSPAMPALEQAFPGALEYTVVGTDALNALLATLPGRFPHLKMRVSDLHGLYKFVIKHPRRFGLGNVTDACFDGVAACANPDKYFFWDWGHPTSKVHRLIAALIGFDLLLL